MSVEADPVKFHQLLRPLLATDTESDVRARIRDIQQCMPVMSEKQLKQAKSWITTAERVLSGDEVRYEP